jgi:large subunit ribosomal protein L31e
MNIHKSIHGVGFRKRASWALREVQKSAMKEVGTPDVHIASRCNKAVWAKGERDVPYHIRVHLSRRRSEHEDSPNKLYTWVPDVPVTTLKNLQSMWVRTNLLNVKVAELEKKKKKKKRKKKKKKVGKSQMW